MNRRGPLPAQHEHPEQSMSLIAPGLAVAANHASLSVPAHAMPGQTRIISSTTDGDVGATEGPESASTDAASLISDEQFRSPSPGSRVQPAISSLGHDKSVGQRPAFALSRSSTAQAEREVSSSDQDGEATALSEPSINGSTEQPGGIFQESQTQQNGYPKPYSRSLAARPASPVTSVSTFASIQEGGIGSTAPTHTTADQSSSDLIDPQVPFVMGGGKSICGRLDDHAGTVSLSAGPGSQPRNANVRAGVEGLPTDVIGTASDDAEVSPDLDGLAVSAGSSHSLGESRRSSISAVSEAPAAAETQHTEPPSSSQASFGLLHRRAATANDKGFGQTALDDLSRPGVRAEANTMPESSQAFMHASNRSMVMRRYGMISPVAGVGSEAGAATSPTGSALTSTAPDTDAPAVDMEVAASSTVAPSSQSNVAVAPAGAQGPAISQQGRSSSEVSSSKGKGSNNKLPAVEFSASSAKQSGGRSPFVDEKNRQHPAEDVEAGGRGFTGIGNAKSHANMSTSFQIASAAEPATAQPTLGDWLTEGLARLGSAASQASVHDDVAPASQAGQLVERVEKAVETLQSHAGKVVRFEVGGPNDERLAVSMQLRDGVLQTVFQTSSQELRDVLARDWSSSVSGSLQGDTSLKVAEPVFNGGGRNDFSDTGADSRQRQHQEAARAQQVPAEASLFGLSRRSASAPVSSADTPSQAPARHVLSTRGLNAIA